MGRHSRASADNNKSGQLVPVPQAAPIPPGHRLDDILASLRAHLAGARQQGRDGEVAGLEASCPPRSPWRLHPAGVAMDYARRWRVGRILPGPRTTGNLT